MNILFLTMVKMEDINEKGIYQDLMRKFRKEGHEVYIVSPSERREGKPTSFIENNGVHIVRVKTLNLQKTNVIEKGIGQVTLEWKFKSAMKKHFSNVRFDIVLYSTPPITFTKAIEWVKKEHPLAMSYLMLKDIFPQNAVDLGMLSKSGLKGLIYQSFRKKEKELYRISDYIGCMSPANEQYVIRNNPEIGPKKVKICPNSYEVAPLEELAEEERIAIRKKYHLPLDRPIFIYGGNMGKPQGIPYLIKCMDANKDREDCHFLIVGNGYDYPKLEAWHRENRQKSVSLFQRLPKADYDQLANACDVGLIFLDYRFTIPNYPSRLLPYLMNKKPILAATDPNSDIGSIAEANGYGIWSPSNDVKAFTEALNRMLKSDLHSMGEKGYEFYLNNYTTQHTYNAIISHLTD